MSWNSVIKYTYIYIQAYIHKIILQDYLYSMKDSKPAYKLFASDTKFTV